jgi:hypothetical protein
MIRRERIAVNHSGRLYVPPASGSRLRCSKLCREGSRLSAITRRRILRWLAAMVAVLVVGTVIGLIWADTSNVAGSIAVASNILGGVGIVVLVIALVVVTRRERKAAS